MVGIKSEQLQICQAYPDANTKKQVIQDTTYYIILLPVIRLIKPL